MKNEQTLSLYHSLHGARIAPAGLDATAVHNLGLVHSLLTSHDRAMATLALKRGVL